MVKFGQIVQFNKEYRSCKPQTINLKEGLWHSQFDDVSAELDRLGYETLEEIPSKVAVTLRKPKTGIYLGTTKINTAFYYDSNQCPSGREFYTAHACGYVEVAEIRCEGIKKSYYVPLDNISWEVSQYG